MKPLAPSSLVSADSNTSHMQNLGRSTRLAQMGSGCLLPTVRVIAIQALLAGFLMGVLHASLARPRWARVLCCLFAILFAAAMIHEGFHPDPHPLFPIEPGAQQVGATFATWAMMGLGVLYAYRMLRGAKARAYFSH